MVFMFRASLLFFAVVLSFTALSAWPAYAAGGSGCSSPTAPEGQMIYNEEEQSIQYCDGDDWVQIAGFSITDVCAGATKAGDNCPDGSVVVGTVDGEFIYTADENQSGDEQWKTSTGSNDIDPDDYSQGNVNHENRSGSIASFAAFQTCQNLNRHGHKDWYLPSIEELDAMYQNENEIDAGSLSPMGPGDYLWSSTEASVNAAFRINFAVGVYHTNLKTTLNRVRCVRRDNSCVHVVGEVCADGSVFAGEFNGYKMFVTDENQTNGMWKTSSGTDDIIPDSMDDGEDNHNNRGGSLSDFPAFEECQNLVRHGKTDWYLPSKDELNVLYTNQAAIDAGSTEAFSSSAYWSSSEWAADNGRAWAQRFSDGLQSNFGPKDLAHWVRCIRRD